MRIVTLFVLSLMYIGSVSAQTPQGPAKYKKTVIKPQDQSSKDPALKKVIDELKKAVKNKDAAALKKLCSKDFTWSFGDDPGIDGFLKNYGLDKNPKSSEFWGIMDGILKNGGTYSAEDKTYSIPYWNANMNLPEGADEETDFMMFYIVSGSDVNVRKKPSSKGDVVAKLSYEMVYVVEWTDVQETVGGKNDFWVKVRLSDG